MLGGGVGVRKRVYVVLVCAVDAYVSGFILYLIYSQCYFWVHDPLNILPYSTLCYSTVRGRALMAVKFKFAMKNS